MNSLLSSSSTVEDYLERILELVTTKGYARVIDIAASLGISQPSVTNMLQKLHADGLVHYEKYRGLTLSKHGEEVARRISRRHRLLSDFLTLLGIPPAIREEDIEGMEHHISQATLVAIEILIEELKEQPALLKKLHLAQSRNARRGTRTPMDCSTRS